MHGSKLHLFNFTPIEILEVFNCCELFNACTEWTNVNDICLDKHLMVGKVCSKHNRHLEHL